METDRNNEKANLFQTKDEESVISNITGSSDTNGLLLHERFHDQFQPQPGCQQFRNSSSLQTIHDIMNTEIKSDLNNAL